MWIMIGKEEERRYHHQSIFVFFSPPSPSLSIHPFRLDHASVSLVFHSSVFPPCERVRVYKATENKWMTDDDYIV